MNARRGSQPAESTPPHRGEARIRRSPANPRRDRDTPFGKQPWRNAALALVALWLALVAWRREIIASPPYWDSAMGLFVEANFLAETNFSYRRLIDEERRFIEGGTGIYLVSVMPTLLATLMWLVPSTKVVIVLGHLANLAVAAALVLLVYTALAPRTGRMGATLAAAALLTTPLFAAQVDMIGMDLPMTLMAFVAGGLFLRERYLPAAVAALAAYFIKLSGLLWLVAAFGCLTLLVVAAMLHGDRVALARRLVGLGLLFVVLAIEMAVMDWVNSLHTTIDQERFVYDVQAGLASLAEVRYWCPDLLLLTAVALLGAVIVSGTCWRDMMQPRHKTRPQSIGANDGPQAPPRGRTAALLSRLLDVVLADRDTLFGWLILLATIAALAQIYTIPRYLLLPLTFLWVNLGLVLFANPAWRRFGVVAAGAVIGFNLLNADGRFFPAIAGIDEFDQRTGALLERSREYLKDHRANLAAVKYLADNAGSRPIIAPNPFVHFLALPRLGYVSKPLTGYAANTFRAPTFPPIEEFRGDTSAGDPLLVWVANRFAPIVNCRLLQPDPANGDELLHYSKLDPDRETIPSLAIFAHRVAPTARSSARLSPAERHAALVAWLFPADDLIARLDELTNRRQFADAVELCRWALATEPMRGDLRLRYALLLEELGQAPAAIAELQRLIDDAPANRTARLALARLFLADKRILDAIAQFDEVLRRDPQSYTTWLQLAQVHGGAGDFVAARVAIARAIELAPHGAKAHLLLARTWRAEGDNAAARRVLEAAVAEIPAEPELWFELGQCASVLRDHRRALDAYRRAYQLKPDSRELANSLAWHLATAPDEKLRDPAEALRLAEFACADRAATRPSWLDTLAAAQAASGQFDKAVPTAEEALAAARTAKDDELAMALEARLKLYRNRQAYVAE
ncbi:MAG: tetratricopeptide repeat protein [Pirellulales bacterium]|nr:tetratricopeptide repeat protein [Pirellulales bacterium]